MKRKLYFSLAGSLLILVASSQGVRSHELNPIEREKADLPAIPAGQTGRTFFRSSETVDYTKGTFIVNEDWFGHQNSSVNFLTDKGSWVYNAFQKENPGKQLGCTSQYGTIYGGLFYIVSKQDKDPGASVNGSRLAVIDAQTMKLQKEFTTIGGADGRSFLGVDEHTGYIGTSNGIWLYNIDKQTIGEQIAGTSNPGGGLYSGQIGTMIRVNNRVFAVHQDKGLLVIDPATHQVETTLLRPEDHNGHGLGSIVLSKDGTLWASATGQTSGDGAMPYLWKIDPTTLMTTQVDIPVAQGIEQIPSSWYAWTADGFCASTRENKLYWKGLGNNSWFSGYTIFCYDIDRNDFYKVLDFTKYDTNDWRLYGTGFRIDPVNDEMYCFLYHEFLNPEHELAVFATDGRGETNCTVKGVYPYEKVNYWFPALPVFPDNEAPVIKANAPTTATLSKDNGKISIPMDNLVEDKDNMTAAIVTTITFDDAYKNLIMADVQNNTLVIKPAQAQTSQAATIPVSLKFNSNGKVVQTQLTVMVEAGATAPFELSESEVVLDKGKTATLGLKGIENETANWSSSDESVATVTDGVITAVATGTATITATSMTRPGITAVCQVTVKREDIVIDNATLNLFDNDQTALIKILSGFATNQEQITWTSSDPAIVSIGSSTLMQTNITAHAVGTAEITAVVTAKSDAQHTPLATAKCVVTVTKLVPVERIELKPVDASLEGQDPIRIEINNSIKLVATVYPENASVKTIKWTSSDGMAFEVENGVVTAKSSGNATITVSSDQGGKADIEKSASVNVACDFELKGVHFEKIAYGAKSGKAATVLNLKLVYEPALPANLPKPTATLYGKAPSDWKVLSITKNDQIRVQIKTDGESEITWSLTDPQSSKTYTATCKITRSKWANSFILDEDNLLLEKGATHPLTYTLDDSNLTEDEKKTKKVLFHSDNTEVATVTDQGVVTTHKPGKATIGVVMSDGSFYTPCQVLVGEVWATKVVCQSDTLRVTQGETVQLEATVEPQNASFPTVTWSNGWSTLTKEGLFTDNQINKSIATATSLDRKASASCVVYTIGKVPLTGISLSSEEISVDLNDNETGGIAYSKLFTLNFIPANASIVASTSTKFEEITSSDEDILKINLTVGLTDSYKFEPKKIGSAQVKIITAENNIQKNLLVHVTDRSTGISGISLDASNFVEESGKKFTIPYHITTVQEGATGLDKTVKWESSDPEIAIVDSQTGEIETLKEGETVIRATTNTGGFTATCRLTVSQGIVKVTGIGIDTESLVLKPGENALLTAKITPENAKTQAVNWSSDQPDIATVDDAGTVVALTEGTAHITVTTLDGGFTATCTVTVSNSSAVRVTGVTLNNTTLDLKKGETAVLKAIVTPANAANKMVGWLTSDETVAAISANGTVTAGIAGTATITVSTDDGGYIRRCEVRVTDPDLDKPTIESEGNGVRLTFPRVTEATKYELSLYKYVNQVPVLSSVYTTDAEGNILSGSKSALRSATLDHIVVSLQQIETNAEFIVKIAALKEADGKTETLGTFYTDRFTTEGPVGNEQIHAGERAITYADQQLRLIGLEGYTCYIISFAGHPEVIFRVAGEEEIHKLYLPKGAYIVTAVKGEKQISQKILINN